MQQKSMNLLKSHIKSIRLMYLKIFDNIFVKQKNP